MRIRLTPGRSAPGSALSVPLLLVLVAVGMAATTNAQVFALLLSPMAQDFGISVARLAGLRTIEEVVAIVTGIALAPFIDRTTRKRLLLSGLALMAAAAAIAVAATSPWHLVGYFAVDGISKILLFSTLLAMPGDLASGRRLDRALGFVIGSFALSGFTIVPLVGYIAARFSWREGYVVAVVTALISFLFVLAVIPAIRPGDRPPASPLRHLGLIVRFPGLATALTGALLRFMMFSSVLTFSGAFLINEHQVSVSRAGVYFSLGAASFLIASILSGFLLQFVGTTRALVHGGMLAATCVLVAFASGVPLSLAGCALLVTVALMGIHENASTGLLLRLSRGQRGAAMSLNELCAAAGALLGIGFGAVALRQFGYGGIGALLGLVGVLAAAVTMRAIRSGDSVDRPETSGGLTVTAPRT